MGDIASANDKPDKGLASLGTIIVEPGSISDPINLDRPLPPGRDLPFGKRIYDLEALALSLNPPEFYCL